MILEEQEAFITGDVSDELLRSAIESEGYTVVGIIKLKNINLPKEEVHEDKGFFSNLLDKIGHANKDAFGEGHLNCCKINKKEKN